MINPKKQYCVRPRIKQDMSAYTKLGLLGKGSFGQVFMAKHKVKDIIVAIKQVKKKQNNDEGLSAAFIKQLSILKKLKHPNIIRFLNYSLDQHEEYAFVVLEYLPTDLQKQLTKGKPTLGRSRSILKQILQAVNFCHNNHIVHRDIKPSNILLNLQTRQAKLGDFGVAKQVYINNKQNTTNVASLYYRAPELIYEDTLSTYSIDVWGLGCVFAECVLGKKLFQAQFANQISQLCAIIKILQLPPEIIQYNFQRIKEIAKDVVQKPIQQKVGVLNKLLPKQGLDLLNRMLCFDPKKRITASQALQHPFFKLPATTKKKPQKAVKPQVKIQPIKQMSEEMEDESQQPIPEEREKREQSNNDINNIN